MTKLLSVLLVLLLTAAAISCSSGVDSGDATAGGETAPSTSSEAPAAAPTAVVINPINGVVPTYGGSLIYLATRDQRAAWDPHGTVGGQSQHQYSSSMWYNNLVTHANSVDYGPADYSTFPDLAERWEISDDGLIFTFYLRQGVKFHDKPPVNGREMVAEDVKWSYERFLKGPDNYRWMLESIENIEIVDNYTLKFHLNQRDAAFLTHMAEPLAWIAAKEAAVPPVTPGFKLEEEFRAPDGLIGTGPFMFLRHEPDTRLVVERNPNYFKSDEAGNQLPYVDQWQYVVISDPAAQEAAWTTGQVDFGSVPGGNVTTFGERNPHLTLELNLPANMFQMWMPSDLPPYNDVRVRRAIMMSIDQDAIMDTYIGGIANRTWGGIPCGVFPEYCITPEELGENAQWWVYDPVKAKALLVEAGYPDGIDVTYLTSNCCNRFFVPELVADSLSQAGIRMKVDVVDHSVYLKTGNSCNYDDMSNMKIVALEPDDLLQTFKPGNPLNCSRVNDPELNRMVDAQKGILNPAERFTALREIQRYLAGQAYVFRYPLPNGQQAWQPWVKGYQPHLYTGDMGREVERIWIDVEIKQSFS